MYSLSNAAELAGTIKQSVAQDLYSKTSNDIKNALKSHWNGNYLTESENRPLDGSVVHAITTFGVDLFAPTSSEAAATILAYTQAFCEEYPLNPQDTAAGIPGVLIGRYPGDHYAGGNPWQLLTAALAECYYLGVSARVDCLRVPFGMWQSCAFFTFSLSLSLSLSLPHPHAIHVRRRPRSLVCVAFPCVGGLSFSYVRVCFSALQCLQLTAPTFAPPGNITCHLTAVCGRQAQTMQARVNELGNFALNQVANQQPRLCVECYRVVVLQLLLSGGESTGCVINHYFVSWWEFGCAGRWRAGLSTALLGVPPQCCADQLGRNIPCVCTVCAMGCADPRERGRPHCMVAPAQA